MLKTVTNRHFTMILKLVRSYFSNSVNYKSFLRLTKMKAGGIMGPVMGYTLVKKFLQEQKEHGSVS